MKYAILIDSGFVKRKLGSQRSPINHNHYAELVSQIQAHPLLSNGTMHRCYIYDAPPLAEPMENPLSQQTIDLGNTPLARLNRSLLDKLRQMPFFSVRLGELRIRGWKLRQQIRQQDGITEKTICADDLAPDIQQKGVDMRIGLDIASLTLKHIVDIIVLVTGDSDFIPAMKFARREGAQVFLVPLRHGIHDTMREHSDLIIDVDPQAIKQSLINTSS